MRVVAPDAAAALRDPAPVPCIASAPIEVVVRNGRMLRVPRLFAATRAIVEACCTAWNSLLAETGRIRSLTDFEWARQVNP